VERWKQPDRDPILRLRAALLEREILAESRIKEVENEVAKQLREVEAWAVASPPPPVEEALHDVYA
jgi:TPP-dependent pyruvate/acetoin dehydrogenase alpha subunit